MPERYENGHALIVGVGGDLPTTMDDAIGLANVLKDSTRCAYPPEQVHLLVGEQSTRTAILDALDIVARSTSSLSTIIIYFSGHGYRVTSPTGEFFYLMPYGYDLNLLYQTAINGSEFMDKLRAISAKQMLILLDCCHAGGISPVGISGLHLTKAPLPPEARGLFSAGNGRVLIASSREDELSFAGTPYSAFTLALLEALSGIGVAKQDGYVRVADLALYAREMVPGRTGGRQHPILNFEHADNFVLAYYAGGDTSPKGAPFSNQPAIEPQPGAWQFANQQIQLSHLTQLVGSSIVGDGNVTGDNNTSYVVKTSTRDPAASTTGHLNYIHALERLQIIIANLAPTLLPEFHEYERQLRESLNQNVAASSTGIQAERMELVKRLTALANRAGLNVDFNDLAR